MSKESLQKRCTDLEIKFQENDTVAQLELMIAGKQSVEQISKLEEDNAKLTEANEKLTVAYSELAEANKELAEAHTTKRMIRSFKVGNKTYKLLGAKLNIPNSMVGKLGPDGYIGGVISVEKVLAHKPLREMLAEKGVAQEVKSSTEE